MPWKQVCGDDEKLHAPAALPQVKNNGTHWIGASVGFWHCEEEGKKSLAPVDIRMPRSSRNYSSMCMRICDFIEEASK